MTVTSSSYQMQVKAERHGRVMVVCFGNPPVNTLSLGNGLVDALVAALRAALSDKVVDAVVIAASGRMFSAGADINDFRTHPDALERMRVLTSDIVENAAKPIVAAIHGMALGGGLELTLAAHYRIAAMDAQFGLPEVTIGLLPGGGGTQRLPRLVGISRALDLMLSGKPISATQAKAMGLIDRIAAGDLVGEAVAWAATLGEVRPSRSAALLGDEDALARAEAQAAKARLSEAPRYIVECVRAGLSCGFVEGMATEAALFERLRLSETSLALRHAFTARRRVASIPDLSRDVAVRTIDSVAVIGAGTMGIGITLALLAGGLPVVLVEAKADALAAAQARIGQTIDSAVAKGRLTEAVAADRKARLRPAASIDAAADVDLAIEAVFEDLSVKRAVFGALDSICKPGAILASNTSTLDVDMIAGFTARPENVIGMHFFSPANIMRLVEVIRGRRTAPDVLATAMAFVRRIGKTGVVAGVCDGFIGNRIFEEYLRQAYFLLEEGALPAQIDGAMERWGMAMGPLKVMDLAGQDIGWSIRKRRMVEQPDRPYSPIPDRICELGRFGQKAGAGFYLYLDGRTATADPAIDALVIARSTELGLARRQITDEEIVDRCVLAMANEGARIVAEGIAYRPLDIDVIYMEGYGFPAERGGPMFQADRRGLAEVLATVRRFRAGYQGWAWAPAPLLVELAEGGQPFASLN